jgi:hypothetical protein
MPVYGRLSLFVVMVWEYPATFFLLKNKQITIVKFNSRVRFKSSDAKSPTQARQSTHELCKSGLGAYELWRKVDC